VSRSTPLSIPVAPDPDAARGPRVLLVDDSPIVMRSLERLLRRGYTLTTATNGRAALDILRRGEVFDAIVCDVAMPIMSGVVLYQTLRAELPDQASRFMFATGGAETLRGMAFLRSTRAKVLLKPFTAAALRAAIDEVARRDPA
jgi:CheY-like chemotaxis protein